MTTDILRLIRIDWDNMENHQARSEQTVGVFIGDDDLTAHGKVAEWFKAQPPINLYLGYDGEVYPQWQLVKDPLP